MAAKENDMTTGSGRHVVPTALKYGAVLSYAGEGRFSTAARGDFAEANYKRMRIDMKVTEAVAELIADADTCGSKGALEDGGRRLRTLIGYPTTAWRRAVQRASSAGDGQ